MSWRTEQPAAEPGRRTAARFGLAATFGAMLLLTAPGVAAAGTNRSSPPDVVPFIDCVRTNSDGSWTAIFGYDNRTSARVTIPVGPANQVTPRGYGNPQPTTFGQGVRHGVFALTVEQGGGPMWHLGATNVAARKSDPGCSTTVEMPADGNGTGAVIALVAGGVVGAGLIARTRRREQ